MRSYSPGGTWPPNTSASVPRLTPLYSARILSSPGATADSVSERSSPRPGLAIQKASDCSDMLIAQPANRELLRSALAGILALVLLSLPVAMAAEARFDL